VIPTALIADDEPLARRKLRDLVQEVPLVEIVGEAADGEAAVRAIDTLRPDLVFLDIQMPGLSGLEVLERARHKPAVIFTTAYDRYAVAAFELAAVDYLLKPFGRERFRAALERARQALGRRDAPAAMERAGQLLDRREGAAAERAPAPRAPLTRLFVHDRGKIVPIAVPEIERFEARDDYVAVHVAGRSYLVHVPMNELERRLDRERFLRVHRSHVVNLDFVKALEPYDGTRLTVELRSGAKIVASRARSRELRALTG